MKNKKASSIFAGVSLLCSLIASHGYATEWKRIGFANKQVYWVAQNSHSDLLVGVKCDGVFQSRDGGNSWIFKGLKGLLASKVQQLSNGTIAVYSQSSANGFSGWPSSYCAMPPEEQASGLFVSKDFAETWKHVLPPLRGDANLVSDRTRLFGVQSVLDGLLVVDSGGRVIRKANEKSRDVSQGGIELSANRIFVGPTGRTYLVTKHLYSAKALDGEFSLVPSPEGITRIAGDEKGNLFASTGTTWKDSGELWVKMGSHPNWKEAGHSQALEFMPDASGFSRFLGARCWRSNCLEDSGIVSLLEEISLDAGELKRRPVIESSWLLFPVYSGYEAIGASLTTPHFQLIASATGLYRRTLSQK